jgi:ketosteroid isomerase-like protein
MTPTEPSETLDASTSMISRVVAVTLLLATPTYGAVIPPDLALAMRQYDEAQVRGDRAALNRLLADDYLLIDSHGQRETKAQLIDDYTAPGFTLEPFKVEQPVEKVWHGGAIMGGVATLTGTEGGQPYKDRLRFTDVWARHAGQWRVLYTHASKEGAYR